MKKMGFWKEFRSDKMPSLFERGTLIIRKEKIETKVLEYLKNGIWLTSLRTQFSCLLTKEVIGTPYIYTDGEWVWTTEYIYYLERYQIELPEVFLNKMHSLNFKVPSEPDLGEELIDDLEKEISSYGYP